MTGAELAAIRKAAGLSQTALAQRAGIGRHAVSYWETKPEVDRCAWAVCRMAEVIDLPDLPVVSGARRGWADIVAAQDAARAAAFEAKVAAWQAAEADRAAKRRVRCGAKTRKGTPCRAKSVPGKRRCKFHGGMSTGARTPEGLDASERHSGGAGRAGGRNGNNLSKPDIRMLPPGSPWKRLCREDVDK